MHRVLVAEDDDEMRRLVVEALRKDGHEVLEAEDGRRLFNAVAAATILFVVVLLAYVRNLISSKRLEAFHRQIDLSEQQLRTLHAEVAAGQSELAPSRATVLAQQAIVADSSRQLGEVRSQL